METSTTTAEATSTTAMAMRLSHLSGGHAGLPPWVIWMIAVASSLVLLVTIFICVLWGLLGAKSSNQRVLKTPRQTPRFPTEWSEVSVHQFEDNEEEDKGHTSRTNSMPTVTAKPVYPIVPAGFVAFSDPVPTIAAKWGLYSEGPPSFRSRSSAPTHSERREEEDEEKGHNSSTDPFPTVNTEEACAVALSRAVSHAPSLYRVPTRPAVAVAPAVAVPTIPVVGFM